MPAAEGRGSLRLLAGRGRRCAPSDDGCAPVIDRPQSIGARPGWSAVQALACAGRPRCCGERPVQPGSSAAGWPAVVNVVSRRRTTNGASARASWLSALCLCGTLRPAIVARVRAPDLAERLTALRSSRRSKQRSRAGRQSGPRRRLATGDRGRRRTGPREGVMAERAVPYAGTLQPAIGAPTSWGLRRALHRRRHRASCSEGVCALLNCPDRVSAGFAAGLR